MDIETGEIRVERVAAIHDVGRVINPLGATSQVEGGIVQGIGHTLSEERLLDPETGTILTQTLDAYRMPTIADIPEIVTEFVDEPDAHLTNLGSKGLGEPPIVPVAAAIANAIRDATGAVGDLAADLPRRDAPCPAGSRGAREADEESVELLRPSSVEELDRARRPALGRDRARPAAPRPARGAAADRSTCAASCRAASDRYACDHRYLCIGAGTTLAELEADAADPRGAPRGVSPRGLAAAAQHGLDRRQPAPGDPLLVLAAQVPVPAARWRPLPRPRGRAPRARDLRQRLLRLGSPFRSRGGLARARGDASAPTGASSRSPSSTACPTEATATLTTLEAGELILEIDVPEPDASAYLKAMDRKRWSFAIVGVAAARFGDDVRVALAGAAPVPWLLSSIDDATPLPLNAYKLPLTKALVERARAQVAA